MKKSMCGILSYICIPNVISYMGQNLGLLKFFKCFVSKSGAQSKHKQNFTSCLFSHSRSEQRFSEWSRSRNFFTRDRKKNLETEPGKNGSALQPWKKYFFYLCLKFSCQEGSVFAASPVPVQYPLLLSNTGTGICQKPNIFFLFIEQFWRSHAKHNLSA